MRFIFHIYIILNILIVSIIPLRVLGDEIILNALAYSFEEEDILYTPLIKKFNEYSKNNNLNITLNLNLFSPSNSTIEANDFGTTVEALLSRKTNKYDIYFYDNVYTKKYGKHFINLEEKIPKDHMELFSSDLNYQLCTSDNRWVGLPLNIDFTVLYSNIELLNRYNKEVPKTWNELIETGLYIYNEELKNNNNDLMIYSGLINKDDESGSSTIIEFIHSYRELKEDPFPDLDSQIAIDALEKLKELKNKTSTDEQFQVYGDYIIDRLFSGKAIFLKFFYLGLSPFYKVSIIPGRKEGVSSSIMLGNNVSASIHSSKEKQEAAIKVIEFITSKENIKELSLRNNALTGISSLYDDEEVCKVMNCELYKSIQPIVRPTKENENYDEYSMKLRYYVYDFIYGDKSAKEVLKKLLI
ncbi:periplasmic binding protein-like II [Anaeromyces robustus]|uniref:Periplasmic binding protein-like II n=1 Tax=Anaeromyces robustus TaxID=1754192 RepID=A0A1Y1XB72_9FUNG|nr:periplasmic binding protein-like II [Anaeromyces robustus]|eukprot:ORX82973.1 periplasmic binding protein-like II [Anaeromyces robustus]